MTRRAGGVAASDANMQALLEAGTPVATIVGKSWDFHVTDALATSLPENLAMIEDTIAFLRPRAASRAARCTQSLAHGRRC